MARIPPTALAALLVAVPGVAAAQFQAVPMVVRLPFNEADVLAGRLAASSGDGLLVLQQGLAQTQIRPWRDLLRQDPSVFPLGGATSRRYRSGYLSQNGADALVDVATPISTGVRVVFGNDPSTARQYATGSAGPDSVASFLRLLPKPLSGGRRPDVLVVPAALDDATFSKVMAVDFDGAGTPLASARSWGPFPGVTVPTSVGWHEAFPVRVSAAAQSAGIDDVAVGIFGGVLLLAHASVPAAATLASVNLAPPVIVGGWVAGLQPPWLPQTAGAQADALGVTSLDVNLDGFADLVFTNATAFGVLPPAGTLLWVQGTGNPADFGNPALTPWHDLGRDPQARLGLVDPLIVRGVEIDGARSFAVWDRALQEIVVATPDLAQGLRVWRAPAPGQRAVDVFLAELVGSTAPDLVVVMANPASRDTVLVYPDTGDLAPSLGWLPGSPGSPLRGVDHAMAVDASDGDGPAPRVEWFLGDPYATPAAVGTTHTIPGDALCGTPPFDVAVTVRATDDLGVFTALSATLPVGLLSPTVTVLGAQPPDRLVLPPGGATLVLDGRAARLCLATITWGGTWPAGATVVDTAQGSTLTRTVTLPEATYPELLAGTPVVTLSTSEPVPEPVATLALALDATGLVEVTHASDRPALAEGEIAVLHTQLRSRLGVPLAQVTVLDYLSGLAPAGDPLVSGASVTAVRGGGTEVLLEPLPAGPATVDIELPVSSLGGRGSSAVEVRSSGGHLLTPAARPLGREDTAVGCSCGTSAAGGLALLALLSLVRPRRRAT